MPKSKNFSHTKFEPRISKDEILYKINKLFDFSFINDFFSNGTEGKKRGRPPIPYEITFKLCLICVIKRMSFRQLAAELSNNLLHCWFIGINPFDYDKPFIHHSTISRHFSIFTEKGTFERVFLYIVEKAIEYDMVGGKEMFQDSTHIKAKASLSKVAKAVITITEEDDLALLYDVNKERSKRNMKDLKPRLKQIEKDVLISLTDKDCGILSRRNKPRILAYLDHRIVDGKCNIILSTEISPGNVHDSQRSLSGFLYIEKHFNLVPEVVGVDSAYDSAKLMKGLHNMGVLSVVVPQKRGRNTPNEYTPESFTYNPELDIYVCPQGQELIYFTTTRDGFNKYMSNPDKCSACPFKDKCTKNKKNFRVINRSIYHEIKERNYAVSASDYGREISRKRSCTVELTFGDSKEKHGFRYARYIGIEKMQSQSFLTATVQNMKTIVNYLFKNKKVLVNEIN